MKKIDGHRVVDLIYIDFDKEFDVLHGRLCLSHVPRYKSEEH